MPIYEYQCRDCTHRFEAIQKFSDAVLTECPSCGKSELRKLLSAPAFRLKGGGWYETDFKSGSKKNIAGDTGASGSSDGGGSTKSTDSGSSTSSGSGSDSKGGTSSASKAASGTSSD